ncbi:Concanavalin A-like lectin/glucanases superfamily protein [Salipiger thiooxidans]|uniref:Concanavalin A-like lectin/glucanases superfamily protein n=1 Tax=Salipiger thiooxidans TaxID=282683 RepID=A0A1G7I2G1_9RHOB|nr:LamG-like jellyroll fold domain-containing protein [Salipiger thiooxidans]SDF06940.1 Concanavalin A-like lectin/glucanases superfamily protein [Salipiger thiooxidans]
MTITRYTQLGAATMARPSASPVTINSTLSKIASVGGLLAYLDPGQVAESIAPLSLKELVSRNHRFNAATTGESPTATTLGGLAAYDYDGANDALDLINIDSGGNVNILPLGASYSVILAAQPDALSGARSLFGGVAGSGTWARLDVNSNGALAGYHGGGAGIPQTVPGRITAGATHLCALSFDAAANTLAVYANGLIGSTVQSGPAALTNRTLQLGNHAASGFQQFDGKIGDVIVFDWAMQAAENALRRQIVHEALAAKWGVTLLG